MQLEKLFKMQKELGKVGLFNYQGEDRFEKLILALLVGLGECANCWRGFKFWSTNQEPKMKELRNAAMMEEDKVYYNPLLEEYVDGLHFVLELGLMREKTTLTVPYDKGWIIKKKTVTQQFNDLFDVIGNFSKYQTVGNYAGILDLFIGLGEMLGFTWEEIEQAYQVKHEINIQRQASGY